MGCFPGTYKLIRTGYFKASKHRKNLNSFHDKIERNLWLKFNWGFLNLYYFLARRLTTGCISFMGHSKTVFCKILCSEKQIFPRFFYYLGKTKKF